MKKVKRFMASILAAALVLSASPGGAATVSAKKATVKSVSVQSSLSGDKKTVYVAKGKKVKLSAAVNVTPDKKANRKVTYKSSKKSVATVSAKGVVKGVKSGKAKITVRSKINKKKKATITVKVMKSAVSKVTLGQTDLTLKAGGSAVLNVTVSPNKGTATEVAWTSSNEKVAAVNAKGLVTAVASGTANITAHAIDGSGKKAVCKVTVTKADEGKDDVGKDDVASGSGNIASMEILNWNTVTFQLKKAAALGRDQVSLMKKRFASGSFVSVVNVKELFTSDNIHYTIILDRELKVGIYLQLAISSADGTTDIMEKQYLMMEQNQNEFTFLGYVGKPLEDTVRERYFDESVRIDARGLPQGLKCEIDYDDPSIMISGTPEKAGTSTAVITVTDEMGNIETINVRFIIGADPGTLLGYAEPVYALTYQGGADDPYYSCETVYLNVAGGSGEYKYKVIADPKDVGAYFLYADEEGYDTYNGLNVPKVKAGDYTVTVQAVDVENPAASCTITVEAHIKDGITVSGRITDAEGKGILEDTFIQFENRNDNDPYNQYASCGTSDDGYYSAYMAPGQYNVHIGVYDSYFYDDFYEEYEGVSGIAQGADASRDIYNQTFTADREGYDFTLPVYKVELVPDDPNISIGNRYWMLDGYYAGAGDFVYLKTGTYTLMNIGEEKVELMPGSWFEGGRAVYYLERLVAEISVTDQETQATVRRVVQAADGVTSEYPAAKDTEETLQLDVETDFPDIEMDGWWYDYREGEWNTNSWSRVYIALRLSIEETGDYELTSGEGLVNLYDEQGSIITPDRMEGSVKQYDGLAVGTYYVGTGDFNIFDYSVLMTHQSEGQEEPTE